jgi:hypothetical protein
MMSERFFEISFWAPPKGCPAFAKAAALTCTALAGAPALAGTGLAASTWSSSASASRAPARIIIDAAKPCQKSFLHNTFVNKHCDNHALKSNAFI